MLSFQDSYLCRFYMQVFRKSNEEQRGFSRLTRRTIPIPLFPMGDPYYFLASTSQYRALSER
jgi:hypothetical protein